MITLSKILSVKAIEDGQTIITKEEVDRHDDIVELGSQRINLPHLTFDLSFDFGDVTYVRYLYIETNKQIAIKINDINVTPITILESTPFYVTSGISRLYLSNYSGTDDASILLIYGGTLTGIGPLTEIILVDGAGEWRQILLNDDGTLSTSDPLAHSGTPGMLILRSPNGLRRSVGINVDGTLTTSDPLAGDDPTAVNELILTSPNGSRRRIILNNDGTLTTTDEL
jgi:hypothetical protein